MSLFGSQSGGGGGDAAAEVAAHEAKLNPHPTYLTQAEGDAAYDAVGAAAAAVNAHVIAADPHPEYLTESEANSLYDAAGAAYDEFSTHVNASDPHSLYARANPFADTIAYSAGGTTQIILDGRIEVFYATAATGATTWVFNGAAVSGEVSSFALELTNGGSQTQTWPTSVKWDSGTAPTLTAAGVDILAFYTRNGGTTWRGFLAAKDSK